MVVNTYLPDVVGRLCRPFLHMGWAGLGWAGLGWAGLGCFALEWGLCLFLSQSLLSPHYSELPLNTQRLCQLYCSGGFASLQHYSQNACLLQGPHYWGLVYFSVVWSHCFLSLKTETSVFLCQSPLDSAVLWGWEGGVYSLLLWVGRVVSSLGQKVTQRECVFLWSEQTYDKYFLCNAINYASLDCSC